MAKEKELTSKELVLFCDEMALILKAGISYEEGLGMISEDVEDSSLKKALKKLLHFIEENTLTYALTACNNFPKYMVHMVEIGETIGRLDEVMASLATYYRRSDSVEKALKNAVLFPFVMALMMFCVILVLIVKILPIFYGILQDFAGEMSGFALGLMHFGIALSKNSAIVTVLLLVILGLLVFFFFIPRGKTFGKTLLTKSFKTTQLAIARAKFSATMAMMLKSGMDIDESLEMAKSAVGDSSMVSQIQKAQDEMEEGKTFADALIGGEIFSKMHGAMISLGVKTGTTDQVMDVIAEEYNDEAGERISSVISIIEPTIVAIFSLLIAVILLSVILPLMGVMSSL